MIRLSVSLALIASVAVSSVAAQAKPASPKRPATAAAPAEKPVWPDEGPATWTPRPTVTAITANDLRTRLYQLADDSMMGRRIGEPGNYKGTEYIVREFARLGLKPAGDNGTFFQDMPYGPIGYDITTSRLVAAGAPLEARTNWVPVAPSNANGFGAGADFTDAPAVFAGRWGDTATVLAAAMFSGKVAVFIATPAAAGLQAGGRNAAPLERCDAYPDMFGATAAALEEAAQRRDDSIARVMGRAGRPPRRQPATRDPRAARLGARAILLVALDAATPASVNGAFNQRSAMQPTESPAAAAAAITASVAERVFGAAIPQLVIGATGQSVSGQWAHTWRMSETPARNVIAMLPGTDQARAGEFVLVGAHNDHVGVNNTVVDHDSLRAVNTVTRPQGANDPVCRPTEEQQRRIDSMIARARASVPRGATRS